MKKYYIGAGLAVIFGLTALFLAKIMQHNLSITSTDFAYAFFSPEEQIELADVIIKGTIKEISQTQWNQDSGEYWEEVVKGDDFEYIQTALPFYTISIKTENTLLADQEMGEEVAITVVGTSPLDNGEGDFSIGDRVVVLAVHSELAWRDGERSILKFLSAPEASLYEQGEDGLYRINHDKKGVSFEDLIAQIAQKRPDIIQP
jgi:hypothetical protein